MSHTSINAVYNRALTQTKMLCLFMISVLIRQLLEDPVIYEKQPWKIWVPADNVPKLRQ